MRKIIAIVLAVLLIVAMAIPAYAVTPKLNIPDMPEIPDISGSVSVELPDEFWDHYFEEHPIEISPAEARLSRNDWHHWLRDWYRWWSNLIC